MTQNSNNQKFTNNADGFDLAGGTTARKITLSGADVDVVGSGTAVITFPSATSTLATLALAETLTNKDLSAASNTLGSANVTAAGALMDSEVTNLAQVKAFDTTDYVTPTGTETVTNKTLTDTKIETSINAQTGTTYTLVLADASKHVSMSNASANTLTVPPNSSVAFPTGTRLMVEQKGAGSTTIAAGAGVTINAPASVALEIGEQYSSRGLLKTATDTWLLI